MAFKTTKADYKLKMHVTLLIHLEGTINSVQQIWARVVSSSSVETSGMSMDSHSERKRVGFELKQEGS